MPPQITVGICAYNEGKNIGKLLDNILNEQKLKEDFELLVVCSGCTDGTVEIVQRFQEKDVHGGFCDAVLVPALEQSVDVQVIIRREQ